MHNIRNSVSTLLILVCMAFSQAGCEGPAEDGKASYGRGNNAAVVNELRKAAGQGDVKAQFELGGLYGNGQGVPQDYMEAVKWYRKAAEQGDAKAQYGLGFMYGKGLGVSRDLSEAGKWYRKAAEQGDAEAQNKLGVMYRYGGGVKRDYVLSYMWCALAASNGSAAASDNRDNVASRMTPEQIAEAQRLIREWKPKK